MKISDVPVAKFAKELRAEGYTLLRRGGHDTWICPASLHTLAVPTSHGKVQGIIVHKLRKQYCGCR